MCFMCVVRCARCSHRLRRALIIVSRLGHRAYGASPRQSEYDFVAMSPSRCPSQLPIALGALQQSAGMLRDVAP